jgi:hypothetical protein
LRRRFGQCAEALPQARGPRRYCEPIRGAVSGLCGPHKGCGQPSRDLPTHYFSYLNFFTERHGHSQWSSFALSLPATGWRDTGSELLNKPVRVHVIVPDHCNAFHLTSSLLLEEYITDIRNIARISSSLAFYPVTVTARSVFRQQLCHPALRARSVPQYLIHSPDSVTVSLLQPTPVSARGWPTITT